MKKLACLLCLCLALSGFAALAEDEVVEAVEMSDDADDYRESNEDVSDSAFEDSGDAEAYFEDDSSDRDSPEDDGSNVIWTDADEGDGVDAATGDDADDAADEAPGAEGDAEAQPDDGTDAKDDGDAEAEPDESEDPDTPDPADDGEALPDEDLLDELNADAGLPEDAQAWFMLDGQAVGGSLKEVIALLHGDETVYVRTSSTVHIRKAPLYILAGVRFVPDPDVFSDGNVVNLYAADPREDGAAPVDFGSVASGSAADVWFRVETRSHAAEPEDPEEAGEVDCAITVIPSAFPQGIWLTQAPLFELSGIPEGQDWYYAVIIYDDRIIPLSGNTYIPSDDGSYSLRFVIQDKWGDMKAVSDKIDVWLDWTPPRLNVEASNDLDYTLNITASDTISGLDALSTDGGFTWEPMEARRAYQYSTNAKMTLPAGTICVRDKAGNVAKTERAYELNALNASKTAAQTAASAAALSGSSSKKSDTGTVSSHASATKAEEDEAEDDRALRLPDAPMRQLTLDGELKDLTLMLDRSAGSAEGRTPLSFTGTLGRWLISDEWEDDVVPADTLFLTADLDAGEEAFNCEWRFNGEVIRELNEKGISYLALRVGDDLCVASTAGFTGGTKYTELKTQGVGTRKFNYTLTMQVDRDPTHFSSLTDNDFSEDCDLSLAVQVEDASYQMSNSSRSPIYYYDVYLGPEDMIKHPLGRYGEEE